MKCHDFTTSLIWLLIGAGISAWSVAALDIGTLQHPGPGFLPTLCGVLIGGLALVVFAQARRRETGEAGGVFWSERSLPRVVATVLALVAYAFLLERAGFVLTTFLVMLVIFTHVARASWLAGILESSIVTGAFYWVFGHLLKIPLPRGWLGI
ncbi:MAG: tripartite tricarboxylate transporter TctB family protein [Candidatus Rokubacteria bacterium]|nr:tripartite tricarboxylate transporter TctB family protein [Candidatus Rokubacteria bacterium]